MASLDYVGPTPTTTTDIANRLQATAVLTSGPVGQSAVAGQVISAAAAYATKSYIDTQDAQFAQPHYYQTQDALLIPLSAVGAANGIAALDTNSQVPVAQMPVLGAGYVVGRFGPTTVTGGTAGATPVDIAHFNIGAQSTTFQAQAYATVAATVSNYGRPVIEARLSNGQTSYTNQTLIARGVGNTFFNDTQAVAVVPVPSASSASWNPNTSIWVTLWLFDANGETSSVDSNTGIVSAAVYLLRVAE